MLLHDTLQSAGKDLPLVSVISPVYNTQSYIANAINSVLAQTYPNWELLFIDDGSTDKSVEIIRRSMVHEPRIRLIHIENHGQGYARNLAVNNAKGKYVLFLDSDDVLADVCLDVAISKLENENSDFVVFDWFYYYPLGKRANYCNKDNFFSQKKLVGEECLSLLKISPIFTVNKVYRLEFLKKHEIKYGEGYIYEDFEFWFKAVLNAKSVSLIHSPLYRVTISQTSSTKTRTDSDFHVRSYLTAVNKSIGLFNQYSGQFTAEDSERAKYDLLLYFYNKFECYYLTRTPKELEKEFLTSFVDEIGALGTVKNFHEEKLITFCLDHDIFLKKKYVLFKLVFLNSVKYKPLKKLKDAKSKARKAVGKLKRIASKPSDKKPSATYKEQLKKGLYPNVVLFMGFDYRYTSNSRYLFEELKAKNIDGLELLFVTDNPLVPAENRIEPHSERFYRFVARSKVIIFESWIPPEFQHRSGTTWIQLWHGTPLKRLLFDSNEKQVTSKSPGNKNRKFNDIQRWDYLLVDNPEIISYFKTCFLFPKSKQLPFGYPRVKYLIENKNDEEYIAFIKELYGISKDKKILLYLPTWRDHNYKLSDSDKKFDTSYIVDLSKLQSLLGDDYEIIYKDHVYLSKPENINFKNFQDAETQELLLVADYLLTDYSSVMFDAMAIDLPVLLYCTDFEKNEIDRGVYEEMWNDLTPFVCKDTEEICTAIKTYQIDGNYTKVKDKYSYKSHGDLAEFVLNIR